ncbi:MAG: glycosyl hydrolase 53 family protein [Oscillospiraceae bacterium]|nr:glycosyl hydrolase 53 family protein [Oscillospiraceae bacterium]
MVLGIDVSTWFEALSHGAAYYDGDTPMDPLEALRKNGVDCMRIRLWNHPYSAEGTPYLGGTCDLENFLKLSHLAEEKGYRIMLDLHYSDFWADPGKQFIPKAWNGLGVEELEQAVYAFTRESLEAIRRDGVELSYIQVGNEITNGLLWPVGRLDESTSPRGNYPTLIRLLKAGIRACREVCPGAQLILHLERSHDGAVYQEFFSAMEKAGVDYDIIGASYYPYWHGTFEQFFANMDACARFGKPRMIVETGYAFTLENYIENGNGGLVVGFDNSGTVATPYPLTPQGQADFVTKLLELSKAHGLAGIFYWEPLWVPGEGICWASEEGEHYIHEEGKPPRNEWANQCLFDYQGRKLPAFDRFAL